MHSFVCPHLCCAVLCCAVLCCAVLCCADIDIGNATPIMENASGQTDPQGEKQQHTMLFAAASTLVGQSDQKHFHDGNGIANVSVFLPLTLTMLFPSWKTLLARLAHKR